MDTGHAGSVFEEHSIYRETRDTRLGGGGGSGPPEGGSGIQNSGTGPTASSGYN